MLAGVWLQPDTESNAGRVISLAPESSVRRDTAREWARFDMAGFEVRRFLPHEADLLRQIRLSSLEDTPEAFGAGVEQERAQTAEWWQQWIDRNPPFGAFVGAASRGLVGFFRSSSANMAHRGTLGGMYVAPTLRGTGAAAALVQAVLDHAATLVEQVHLSVNADNDRAVRFYRRMGFVEYGREPAGLRYAGVDHDVLLMVRMLDRDKEEDRP